MQLQLHNVLRNDPSFAFQLMLILFCLGLEAVFKAVLAVKQGRPLWTSEHMPLDSLLFHLVVGVIRAGYD